MKIAVAREIKRHEYRVQDIPLFLAGSFCK